MKKRFILFTLVVLVFLILTACGGKQTSGETATPSIDAAALVETRCTACHGMAEIERQALDVQGWTGIVDRMIGAGAVLNAAEKEAVVSYLAEKYPAK